jgi:riboflavin synthase
VQGHVDATSHILDRKINDDDVEFLIALPQELDGLLISKGSIAVDGISLTISALFSDAFRVNIIPHTLSATTLESAQKGYRVNLEADMLGKYIAAQLHKSHRADSSRLSMDDLLQAGF